MVRFLPTSNFQWRFDGRRWDFYLYFAANYAEQTALLDEATGVAEYRPANVLPATGSWLPANNFNIDLCSSWAAFYRWKLGAAQFQGDASMMLDCLARMQTISSWLEASPAHLDWMAANTLRAMMLAGTATVLPQLPGDALPGLQRDITAYRDNLNPRLRRSLMNERVVFNLALEHLATRPGMASANMPGQARLLCWFPKWLSLWKNSERAVYLDNMREAFLFLDKEGRITYGTAERYEEIRRPTRLPLTRALPLIKDYCLKNYARVNEFANAALVGVAVERYRRTHGALPESLDALAPEFLERVPLSNINNRPLMYKSGEFEVPTGGSARERFNVDGYMVYGPVHNEETGASTSFTVAVGAIEKLPPLE